MNKGIWRYSINLSKTIFATIICLAALFHIQTARANCGSTNILITNATNDVCRLVKSNLIHGYFDYVSSAPRFIPANTTAIPIILSQSFYGSELELRYDCGNNRSATLYNQHDYRMFFTGHVEGKVIDLEKLTVEVVSVQGNCLWSEHASIQWLLR